MAVALEKTQRLRGASVPAADTILIGDTPLDVEPPAPRALAPSASPPGPTAWTTCSRRERRRAFEDLRDSDALIEALGGLTAAFRSALP